MYGELEEDLKVMVGRFVEVGRRKGLKVNADTNKVMVLDGEEGSVCEVLVDGARVKHVSEFKCLRCCFSESGTYGAGCCRRVANGGKVIGGTRSLVNARGLQLECARVLHEALLMLVLLYGSETIVGGRKRSLGLGLCKWTTLEVC